MTSLNFAPRYEALIKDGRKTTTLRLGYRLEPRAGQVVDLTIGDSDCKPKHVGQASIIQVKYLTVATLTDDDLEGESPDCRSVDSAVKVLGEIYAHQIEPHDALTLIRFQPL